MKRHVKLLILIAIIFSMGPPKLVIANTQNGDLSKIVNLTLEAAHERILDKSSHIKYLQIKLASLGQQRNDLRKRIDELSQDITSFIGGNLPISAQYFLSFFPDYEQLTEVEQAEIDQYIAMQIMINQSLNQLLDEQANQQQVAWERNVANERKALNGALRMADAEYEKGSLELIKAKDLAKLEVTQKYYTLLIQQNNIVAMQMEYDYLKQHVVDIQELYNYGLASLIELADANEQLENHTLQLQFAERDYAFNIEDLCIMLELSLDKNVQLEQGNQRMINKQFKEYEWLEMNDILDQDVDLVIINEDVDLYRNIYEKESDTFVKNEHLFMWIAKTEEREILKQQVEQKWRQFQLEYKHYISEINRLEKERINLEQKWTDINTQYEVGIVTIKELEVLELELEKVRLDSESLSWEIAVFLEKIKIKEDDTSEQNGEK